MNKLKSILSIVLLTILCSCGSNKAVVNHEDFYKEINTHVKTVDSNNTLKKEMTEGALTDSDGFKDIGTFKYTVYFDEKTKELFKINNLETTNVTVNETYYFKDGKFLFVKLQDSKNGDLNIYNVTSNGKEYENLNFYKDKAKRFQKAFKKSH